MDRPLRSDIGGDDYLDALIGGFPDAVVLIDSEGIVIRASTSVRSLLGWVPSDLIGQSVNVIIPEPHRAEHDGYIHRFLETGKSWALGTVREFDVLRKDGSKTPCEISVSSVKIPGRRGLYFCGAIRGIADRLRSAKRLALSEAKFRAVFENENEFVLLVDADGLILEANRPTYVQTGCMTDDVQGRPLALARFWSADPGNREAIARLLESATESGLATAQVQVDILEERGVPPGGGAVGNSGPRRSLMARPHSVSVRLVDLWEEGLPHAIVEVRDVTELVLAKERESAIVRSLALVGEEAAVLAHELRSPVSELELALRAVSKGLGEDEGAIVEDLARRMRRLERLLQRTLGFSKPLDLKPQPLLLDQAVHGCIDRESSLIQRHNIQVDVQVPSDLPLILGDPEAFGDLLSNLVRNAAEAQDSGAEQAGDSAHGTGAPDANKSVSRIEIRASVERPGRVAIHVEDDGPGVAAELREEVFRVFMTGKEGGTGFGLALVRKIAEAHGATVHLDAGRHGGLLVHLDWPCETPSAR